MPRWHLLYGVGLVIRLVALLLPAYLHPDEVFQSPDVAARWLTASSAAAASNGTAVSPFDDLAWEWDPAVPCRSPLGPALSSAAGLAAASAIGRAATTDQGVLHPIVPVVLSFIGPRVQMGLLSFVTDLAVVAVVVNGSGSTPKAGDRSPLPYLAVLSWSHALLTFALRPFSNSLELQATALGLALVHAATLGTATVGLAVVTAASLFVRFTFVALAAPLWIFMVWRTRGGRTGWWSWPAAVVACGLAAAGPFLATTAVLVVADSVYFGSLASPASLLRADPAAVLGWVNGTDGHLSLGPEAGSLVLTPLNSLLYNMDPANLASHGLHHPLTHVAVNLPLLYAPMMLGGAIGWLAAKIGATPSGDDRGVAPLATPTRALLAAMAVVYVGVLSSAPHQEARFLLPLLLPVVLLLTPLIANHAPRSALAVYLSASLVCLAVFGLMHQGGLVPALMTVADRTGGDQAPVDPTVVFHHTYGAPAYIVACLGDGLHIKSIGGASAERLARHLCSARPGDVFVAAPLSRGSDVPAGCAMDTIFPWHVSFDNFPANFNELGLGLWACDRSAMPCHEVAINPKGE